jgi:hypothetical protein
MCTVQCTRIYGKKAEIFAEKERPTRPTTRINGHRVGGGGGDWAYTVQAVDTYTGSQANLLGPLVNTRLSGMTSNKLLKSQNSHLVFVNIY